MTPDALYRLALFVPVLLFSVIAHEIAHGYAALRQGDPTAYQLGRLTWNPARHIDPFMTILLPAVLYVGSHGTLMLGGAKPVPVNPRNYRNFKRGDIIVSLAGVATNLVIALVATPAIALVGLLGRTAPGTLDTMWLVQQMFINAVWLNLGLIAFNLIPIPPLDGSHVMKYLLPPAWSLRYQAIARQGILLLILLLVFGGRLLDLWMTPARLVTMGLLGSVSHFFLGPPDL